MEQRTRAQVMAEEDKRIFEILDMMGRSPMCHDASHRQQAGAVQRVYPVPCHECPHPECVARSVIES